VHALESLAAEPRITVVQPVIARDDEHFAVVTDGLSLPFELLPPVAGGTERAESMQRGMLALPPSVEWVAVHDAARPLPSKDLLQAVCDAAFAHGAAVPGVKVSDTIKRIDDDGRVIETLERQALRAVQTPQVARRDWFEAALANEKSRLHTHTDDASMLEAAGYPVYVSEGDIMNRKITTPEDIAWLEKELAEQA
jgi:2-C-methyl-D-erythritol 4-phosphate cytidylyltransferase